MKSGNATPDEATVFARNRAYGRVELSVRSDGGRTRRGRVAEAGSLRVRMPSTGGGESEAVLLNTAGGIAGGDDFAVQIEAGPDSRLTVTSTSAEKIYRATAAPSRLAIKLSVAEGARLRWLPQEMILFDGAHLVRSIEADVAEGASLVMAEATILGRKAMGEIVRQGTLVDHWRVRRAGQLVFADTLRLADDIAGQMRRPAAGRGATAFASILFVPGDEALVVKARELFVECESEAGASAWNGVAVIRLCGSDAAGLRRDLFSVLNGLSGVLPRLWTN